MKSHLIGAHPIPNHTDATFFTVLLLFFLHNISTDVNSQADSSFKMATLKLKDAASSSASYRQSLAIKQLGAAFPTLNQFELVSSQQLQ